MYMSVKQAAEKWGISDRRVQPYAQKGKSRGLSVRDAVGRMGAKHEPVQPYLIQPKMEKLFAGYVNTRLDSYLAMLASE